MDNPVRKMVQFDPKLLTVLKQLSRDVGLEPDQVVNLALYELGCKLGHIKVTPREVPAPQGVDLFDEVGPAPPPRRPAAAARKPAAAQRPAKPAKPAKAAKPARPAHDLLYVQFDDGPMTPIRKDVFLIGRGSKCDHIIHHRSVSREHAVITRERSGWFIEDLNSANGTWVDGEQITKHKILGGEEISISNHVLRTNIRAG